MDIIRFLPPDDFNLVLLSLELEFVKRGTKSEQVLNSPPMYGVYYFGFIFQVFVLDHLWRSNLIETRVFFLFKCNFQIDAILLAGQLRKKFNNQVYLEICLD